MSDSPFTDVETAAQALAAGEYVVLVDDDSPTATGALAGAAEPMTTERLVWLNRRTTGLVGVPMTVERANALGLEL